MQEVEKLRATEEKHIDWQEVFGKDSALSRADIQKRLIDMKLSKSIATSNRIISQAKEYEELCKEDGKRGRYTLPEMTTKTEEIVF